MKSEASRSFQGIFEAQCTRTGFHDGGGAVFAAWPPVYAASFSGFYIAMFLVLATLILRPVGFEFRNKLSDTRWSGFAASPNPP